MRKVISVLGMKLPVAKAVGSEDPTLQHHVADRRVRYGFDAAGRVSTVEYPDRSSQAFDYDQYGNLARRRTPAGRVLRYDYDSRHRLRSTIDDRGAAELYRRAAEALQDVRF